MDELGVDEKLPVLRKTRWQTGIADLDIILEGGYKNPGNILFIGPSGMEKAAFAYHFADAASAEEDVYFICGGSAPEEIIKRAATLGVNLKKDNVKFIDCYTMTLGDGKSVQETEKLKYVPGPSALNDLSLALNDAVRESSGKKLRIIFHTLSTFVLYNPQDSIRKFMDVVEGRLKTAGATTIYLIDEGVHDKQLMGILEHGMDEVYTITEKEGYNLEVPLLPVPLQFRLGPSGIVII
ncbi:MAG: ATPase domain-containing protein [Candidatus Micrarchaeota archaeon]